jgi:hypothetical protein
MKPANENRGPQDAPQYYRAQAMKARQAADEDNVPADIRDTYLEIAEQWEKMARRAEQEF